MTDWDRKLRRLLRGDHPKFDYSDSPLGDLEDIKAPHGRCSCGLPLLVDKTCADCEAIYRDERRKRSEEYDRDQTNRFNK